MYDYVHPRTVLPDGTVVRSATPASVRIYQFPHNRRSPAGQRTFTTLTGLRDQIETAWEHDARYRAERVEWHDFVQVTRFFAGRSGLPKHSDYNGPRTQPFLQAFMFLSRPSVDFHGGDMTLFPSRGPSVRVATDLDLDQGDLLLFDRSLLHEVEPTAASTEHAIGRWSVVLPVTGGSASTGIASDTTTSTSVTSLRAGGSIASSPASSDSPLTERP